MFACARHRSFPQQRARGPGSDLQSQIGFYADTEVRDRAKIAGVAELQISAAKIGAADCRTGLCHLLQLLCLVRGCPPAVPVGTVPAYVSSRGLLCLPFVAPALIAESHLCFF